MNYVGEAMRPAFVIAVHKEQSRQMAYCHYIPATGWGRGHVGICMLFIVMTACLRLEKPSPTLHAKRPFKSSLGLRKNQPYGGLLR